MGALIVVGLIALVVIVFAVQGLKIIRQGETKVIESYYVCQREHR